VPSAVPDEAGQLARDGGGHLRVRLAARLAFLSSLDGDLGAVGRFQNVSILAEFNLVSESSLIGRALATEGLARGLALMIGDRKEDIEGARANGVRSIGVTWGYGSREELEGAGADHIASSVPELLGWLGAV
jgi:phosphoglycolate phosphatase